jgi:hypothetical protein
MKTRFAIIISALCIMLLMGACKSNNGAIPLNSVHEVTVKEFINTSAYTYVLVLESGKEQWLAIPKTEIKVGGTYYYKGGMVMNKFESKELKKTFESVLFLEILSDNKDKLTIETVAPMHEKNDEQHTNINSRIKKAEVKISPLAGGISIAQLFDKKSSFSGKKVKITGVVIKFSPDIMKKNWVHIQDGSENNGKFDLTITTKAFIEVGDTVSFEGEIILDKDFGYGYKYEVLMEDAVISK